MPAKSELSGLLNLNKPGGPTSHDVVQRVRRLTGQRKVGHAGTLDPLATGVLLVCLGQATRLIEYLTPGRKQYRAVIHFGLTTDTLDADGQVITSRDPSHLTETHLRQLLPAFLGKIDQIPPLYSALKHQGRPLYKRARAGQTIDLQPRRVTIDSLTWVDWQPPRLTLDITCSAGTYIRALARDLGEAAGVGAHLSALTRTASGGWTLAEAVSLSQLEIDGWQPYLQPPDQAVAHLPRLDLTEQAAADVGYGRQIELDGPDNGLARAYTPTGEFLAILTPVKLDDKLLWQPEKVFQVTGSK
jgi:tRNA pseudouridine55 synthase